MFACESILMWGSSMNVIKTDKPNLRDKLLRGWVCLICWEV